MSPGLKYRHYVPAAPLTLFVGDPQAVRSAIEAAVKNAQAEGKTAGVIAAGIREEGAGVAVMNRMRNAADGKIVRV